MPVNRSYNVTERERDKKIKVWTTSDDPRDERVYTYDEAIDLAGN